MTDNIETDHIPDAGKKVLGANNSANISSGPFSDEGNGDNTKDMDTAQLIELGKAAFNKFCEEYEMQGLVNASERAGFETGYRYAIQSQASALAKSEAQSPLMALRDAFDDLQEEYGDISLNMSGDEKEVTKAKTRNVYLAFADLCAEIISETYNEIPRGEVMTIEEMLPPQPPKESK